jgi:hypothetical protein
MRLRQKYPEFQVRLGYKVILVYKTRNGEPRKQ